MKNKSVEYYMNLPYKIMIVPDSEGIYTLYYPELPGCITTSTTLEGVIANAVDAKKCWFSACIEDGIDIPEPNFAESTYI